MGNRHPTMWMAYRPTSSSSTSLARPVAAAPTGRGLVLSLLLPSSTARHIIYLFGALQSLCADDGRRCSSVGRCGVVVMDACMDACTHVVLAPRDGRSVRSFAARYHATTRAAAARPAGNLPTRFFFCFCVRLPACLLPPWSALSVCLSVPRMDACCTYIRTHAWLRCSLLPRPAAALDG